VAIDAATDRKATDLKLLDLRGKCDYADYFLICSGRSDRQVTAIAESIDERLRAIGQRPLHTEGKRQGHWILIDYADLVVHVFDPATRDFYRLDRLWSDAPVLRDFEGDSALTASSEAAFEGGAG
jgi:ribosome-associated protein